LAETIDEVRWMGRLMKHDKAYDQVAAPSAGGTTRPGKDSANCNDALGDPGRHRGSHSEAVTQSGRGPRAAKKQMGRNWLMGTPAPDLK
jgi:hypothetical protein